MDASTLDRLSRPLREAATRWAREHGEGFCGGWDRDRNRWVYKLSHVPIFVEVSEDGANALVWLDPREPKSAATTPRGLRRLLDRLART